MKSESILHITEIALEVFQQQWIFLFKTEILQMQMD